MILWSELQIENINALGFQDIREQAKLKDVDILEYRVSL
jgi:hypothetical protein